MRSQYLITADALNKELADTDLRILDASFFLPSMGRNAILEFQDARIPGAQFFDINTIADQSIDLPHMLPPPAQFTAQMQALGICQNSRIVVYDNCPLFSAARCWWMFRYYGHSQIRVLDGGFQNWQRCAKPVASGSVLPPKKGDFQAGKPVQSGHITLAALRADMQQSEPTQIVDARSKDRFDGRADEPRPGLASGHMKGACNLPIMEILDESGCVKPEEEIKRLFEAANLDLTKPIITTCGSGVTASGLTLALALLDVNDVQLYDGSWAQWASQDDALIETSK